MLRICFRDSGGGQRELSPSSHRLHVEEVDLLRPQHAGEGLALDQLLVVRSGGGLDGRVELVRLPLPLVHDGVDVGQRGQRALGGQAKAQGHRRARGHHAAEDGTGLGPDLLRADAVLPEDQGAVERVLDLGPAAPRPGAVDPGRVRLVVGEQEPGVLLDVEVPGAETILEGQAGEGLGRMVVGDAGPGSPPGPRPR